MKVKVRKDKLTGEMNLAYFKVSDKALFRYKTLKNIFEKETDITILIDTNQRNSELPDIDFDDFLKRSGVIYLILPTKANKTSFFGLSIDLPRKKKEEKLIILHIIPEQFTPELYRSCIENFDIGIGIGSKEAFNDILKSQRFNVDDILFNDAFFEKSIYDSILCASIRSTFNIERYIDI